MEVPDLLARLSGENKNENLHSQRQQQQFISVLQYIYTVLQKYIANKINFV